MSSAPTPRLRLLSGGVFRLVFCATRPAPAPLCTPRLPDIVSCAHLRIPRSSLSESPAYTDSNAIHSSPGGAPRHHQAQIAGDHAPRRHDVPVSEFDDLLDEAERVPVGAWDFRWLEGRAVEDRPSWRYFDRVAERAADVSSLLEIQAGVGSMIGALPSLPMLSVATEGFPPSIVHAAPRLRARGVPLVVTAQASPELPFADGSFELVISRHPIEVWWDEIARVLQPGGTYFAQHVGPHSLRSLSEFLMGPLPDSSEREPHLERLESERAGLIMRTLRLEQPRTAFYDIGAVVYFLRLVPWIVPGFTVLTYRDSLLELHTAIERDGAFETTACRTLIEATKPL